MQFGDFSWHGLFESVIAGILAYIGGHFGSRKGK